MSYLTRDERLELQDEDNGNEDDDIFIRDGTKVITYHNDKNCRTLDGAESIKTDTRKAA